MRIERLLRFAAFAGIMAVLPAAAQVTVVANPSQVNLSTTGQTTAQVQIWGTGTAAPTTTFIPTYPTNGTDPWLILQPAGTSDPLAFCNPCLAGSVSNPATFTLRLIPSRVPAGVFSGTIGIGGTGIAQNVTYITANLGGAGSNSPISANPTGLTFTQSDVGPKSISLSVFGAVGVPTYSLGFSYATSSDWLIVNPSPNAGFVYNSPTITVTAVPGSKPAGTYTANLTVTRSGVVLPDVTIPITMTIGQGLNTITANPSSLSLSSAVPSAAFSVTINPAIAVPYELHNTNPALVSASGPASPITNGAVITVTAVNALATGTANIIIRPASTSGFGGDVTIPVTLNGQTAGKVLNAFPAQVTLSTQAPTQSISVTPSVGEAVPVTVVLSQNLQTLAAQGLFQIFGSTGTIGPGATTLSFALPNPNIVVAQTGSVTLNPVNAAQGYAAINIPIYINSGGTGNTLLSVNPTSITAEATAGGSTVTRTVSVTSADFYSLQSFTAVATTTSGSNWLSVSPSFAATPANLVVTINPAALTPGTYTGSIGIASNTTAGTYFPITIPVSVTVVGNFTVAFNPTALSLTAPSNGSTVTTPVQVTLSSGSGNPAFTTTVSMDNNGSWLTASSNSTTLPATVSVSANPSGLPPGTYGGRVTVLSGTSTIGTVPVTLTVTAPATLQLSNSTLSFAHQTTSTSNPPTQTVQVNASGATVNWSATATSAGNWLQVSPSTGSTPATLNVVVNPSGLTAGTYTGTVSVSSSSASNSPQTITVGLTVTTPAIPQVTSVLNSASSAPSVAVPGLIFTIKGTDLGGNTPVEGILSGGAYDTTLGGVRVLFDGIPSPLLYVSSTQVNGVMPFELYGRFSTRMVVEARNQRSREIELRVADTAPGLFTLNSSGSGPGAILNQNSSVNLPGNPADRGSVIVLYGTGHGQTNPTSVTGRIATQAAIPLAFPVRVNIGGVDAVVTYAGPAPGLVSGATQINAIVPAESQTGSSVPVTVQIGGAFSQANVTVSIR